MEHLWAFWRSSYIETFNKPREKTENCFLCEAIQQPKEKYREYLVLHKGKKAFIIMNLFPYNGGHLMVCPIRHISDFLQLTNEELEEINLLIKVSINALRKTIKPHGFNIGWNIGRVAGAGLESHIHCHIVPRWHGDTNFMPILSQTKVISQHFLELYDKLFPAIKEELKNYHEK
jgi:ATP adenylyltransferase